MSLADLQASAPFGFARELIIAMQPRRFTIRHPDGSPYLTRWVLRGCSSLTDHDPASPLQIYIHRLHTPDGDRHPHDHPWQWSCGIILQGGYTELRRIGDRNVAITHTPGSCNRLDHGDYHSVVEVEPGTFTLFIAGREVSDWGFLVDGVHVPHRDYLQRQDAQAMTHTEDGRGWL